MILVVTPDRNTAGKKDFSGAFLPQALAFMKRMQQAAREVAHVKIDLSKPMAARRKQLLTAIAAQDELTTIAFFCHGLTRKLPQLGWDTKNVGELVSALTTRSPYDARDDAHDLRVVLYACSTAQGEAPGGDNGFADRLRDALCASGSTFCQVDAHEGAGHTTMNPRVRRFEGHGSSNGGIGGAWIVTPGSPKYKAWARRLREDPHFRFDFPFMTAQEIVDSLP